MENQIALVEEFVKAREDLELVDIYFDNGFSGTNFRRPAFARLMADVRRKRIACIVVKDLSRFGRNYLEAGYYIETIFPFLGVRLISVTDHFDSSRESDMEGLLLPIRNMVNSMYAKDISKKVWNALQQKKERGQPAGTLVPYGYRKNVEGRYEPDPETAPYVALLFQWKRFGVSAREIAERLELLGAPTPRQHLCHGGTAKKRSSGRWNVSSVCALLRNHTYAGDTVTNKTSQALFAGREKRLLPPEEWNVFPDTHIPLVSRVDFEEVQFMLGQQADQIRARRSEKKTIQARGLSGLVFCRVCGARMEYQTGRENAGLYRCGGREGKMCERPVITEALLKMRIYDQIRAVIRGLFEEREGVCRSREWTTENLIPGTVEEIEKRRDQLDRLMRRREQLYEDLASGILDREEYRILQDAYQEERDRCQCALREAEEKRQRAEECIRRIRAFAELCEPYCKQRVFPEDMIRKLVIKIEVDLKTEVKLELVEERALYELRQYIGKEEK